MRKLRFTIALALAFIKKFKYLLIAGVVIGVCFFFVSKLLLPSLFSQKVEYVGYVGRFHIDALPPHILSYISEGLTKIDERGVPQPALAKSWEALDNGKTWKFTLDATKTWSDGTAVTSSSITYSFDNVTIEKPDEATVVFKLQNAYAPFPVVVAHPVFKRGLIGTGEWKATSVSVSNTFVDRLELARGTEKRVIRFFPSEDAAKTGFQLGQVDILEHVFDPAPFDSWQTTSVEKEVQDNRYVAIFLNTRSELFKNNKSLRQALAYATNKGRWSEEERAVGPIPSNSWGYSSQVKRYDFDVARAKELVADLIPKGGTLSLKLTTNPNLLSLAEEIAKDWAEIGVVAQIQASSNLSEEYDAYLALYEVSLDPDQYLTWHSTQEETNVTHFANQRIDKLLEDGRLEMDPEKRKKIYLDFQRFLLEESPAIFLYHPQNYTVFRK